MSEASDEGANTATLLTELPKQATDGVVQIDGGSAPETAVTAADAGEAPAVPPPLRLSISPGGGSGCPAASKRGGPAARAWLLAVASGVETDASAAAAGRGSSAGAEALTGNGVHGIGPAADVPDSAAGEYQAIGGDPLSDGGSTDDAVAVAEPIALREAFGVVPSHSVAEGAVNGKRGDPATKTGRLTEEVDGSAADGQVAAASSGAADGVSPAERASPTALGVTVNAAAATVVSSADSLPAGSWSSTSNFETADTRDAGHPMQSPVEASSLGEAVIPADGHMDSVILPSRGQPDAPQTLAAKPDVGEVAAHTEAESSGHAAMRIQHPGEVESHPLSFGEEREAIATYEPQAKATAGDVAPGDAKILESDHEQRDDGEAESEPRTPGTPDASPPTPTAAAAAHLPSLPEQPPVPALVPVGPGSATAAPAGPQVEHRPFVQTARVVHPDVYFATTRAAMVRLRTLRVGRFRDTFSDVISVAAVPVGHCCVVSVMPCTAHHDCSMQVRPGSDRVP